MVKSKNRKTYLQKNKEAHKKAWKIEKMERSWKKHVITFAGVHREQRVTMELDWGYYYNSLQKKIDKIISS